MFRTFGVLVIVASSAVCSLGACTRLGFRATRDHGAGDRSVRDVGGVDQDAFSSRADTVADTDTVDGGTLLDLRPDAEVCPGCSVTCCNGTCCEQGDVCTATGVPACCTPNWVDSGQCSCTRSRCGSCTGTKEQTDGCGHTRQVACCLAPSGCPGPCCDGTCCASGQVCSGNPFNPCCTGSPVTCGWSLVSTVSGSFFISTYMGRETCARAFENCQAQGALAGWPHEESSDYPAEMASLLPGFFIKATTESAGILDQCYVQGYDLGFAYLAGVNQLGCSVGCQVEQPSATACCPGWCCPAAPCGSNHCWACEFEKHYWCYVAQ